MAEKKPMVVYAASYDSVSAAPTDLHAIEQLHKDEMIGTYDAAVIDNENGKPRIVKRNAAPQGAQGSGGRAHRRSGGAGRGGRADDRKGRRHSPDRCGQGGEADRGCHHRRNHQRAAGSAQELKADAALPESGADAV